MCALGLIACRTFDPSTARLPDDPSLGLPVAVAIDDASIYGVLGSATTRSTRFTSIRTMDSVLFAKGNYVVPEAALGRMATDSGLRSRTPDPRGLHLSRETDVHKLSPVSRYIYMKGDAGGNHVVVSLVGPFSQDAQQILDRELVREFVAGSGTAPSGTLGVGVENSWAFSANSAYTIGGSMLGGVPFLLGFPIMALKVSVALDAKITDRDGRVLGRYHERGGGATYLALYWGQWMTDEGYRRASAFAVLDALAQIREKIEEDLPRLRNALASGGSP